jgi:serine/threonine-protein kinase
MGAGATGTVYLAVTIGTLVPVALKVAHFDVDGTWKGRAEREATVLRVLKHRNIASFIESGQLEDGRHVIVSEYVRGETLSRVARWAGGSLPWRRVVSIGIDVLEALSAAHASGILHRDVKPDNVMLCQDAEGSCAKLVDWGLCFSASLPSITLAGEVLGTTEYMAPERCNEEPYDARSDLYSVAVMLYSLLCGTLPFAANSVRSLIDKCAGVPAPAMRVPPGREKWPSQLDAVVMRGLSFAPDQRFASARAFADELRSVSS